MRTAIGLAMALGKYIIPGNETEVWNILHNWPDREPIDPAHPERASKAMSLEDSKPDLSSSSTTEIDPSPPASSQTQASGPAATSSASEDGAAPAIASDNPINLQGLSSRGRADIRMGRGRGKGTGL